MVREKIEPQSFAGAGIARMRLVEGIKSEKIFCSQQSILNFAIDLFQAWVAELVDALDSKSSSFESAGSIPAPGTKAFSLLRRLFCVYLPFIA